MSQVRVLSVAGLCFWAELQRKSWTQAYSVAGQFFFADLRRFGDAPDAKSDKIGKNA